MKVIVRLLILFGGFYLISCSVKNRTDPEPDQNQVDSAQVDLQEDTVIVIPEAQIEKSFLYDQHTLTNEYPYRDTTRRFQWEKIRAYLTWLDSIQMIPHSWGILQNYKNKNGEAALIRYYQRNEYRHISDTFGVERYQSVPLFLPEDTTVAERYGRDGSLIIRLDDGKRFSRIATVYFEGTWLTPSKYVKAISDTVYFRKTIFVDLTNQNITTLEKDSSKWLVRSMNPATTGLHNPPHAYPTPPGIFVIQEKKSKMIYLHDYTHETEGFAPYASRFSNGGYIHGVPVNLPRTELIEFSSTLGTKPRSHMCVRNATSHAKFIYGWAPVDQALVFVFD